MIYLTNLSAMVSTSTAPWSCAISMSRANTIGLNTLTIVCEDLLGSLEPAAIDATSYEFTKDTNVGTDQRTHRQIVLSFFE